MPKYIVFLLQADRPGNRSEDNQKKAKTEAEEDPAVQKLVKEFLDWMESEMKAERLKSSEFLEESTEENNIRVEFQVPDPPASDTEEKKDDDAPFIANPKFVTTRGHLDYVTSSILGLYTAEFATPGDASAWAQSCPLAYDGFALEIRQLKDTETAISEATPELKERVGDQILYMRKKALDEGKMKKDEDGTLWVKVVDEDNVKELVAEAEKRDEA